MKSIRRGYHLGLIAVFLAVLIFAPLTQQAWAGWEHFDPNNTNELSSSHITSIVMDPNRLWIGTDQGLVEYNLSLDDPNTGWTKNTDIDPNYISSMDIDQNIVLWLGTPQGLVSYEPDSLDPNKVVVHPGLSFTAYEEIKNVEVDTNFVWVATDTGLNQYDKSSAWSYYSNDPNGFDSFFARGVDSIKEDVVWVLPSVPNPFGVYRYTVSSDQWDYFGTSSGQLKTMVMGDSNDIWFGSEFGLWRYETDPNVWTNWKDANSDLPSDSIQVIAMYRGLNRVIVATVDGLARYDLDLDLWQPISTPAFLDLGSQIINDILVDPNRHQIWFGTESGGLYRWKEGAITWSNPANGSENVSIDTNYSIEVVFNDRIDPNSIELGEAPSSLTFTMLDTNNNIIVDPNIFDPNDFAWHFRDPNTNTYLIIEPKKAGSTLYPDTWYYFKFTTAITDYTGKSISSIDSELLFKTLLPPTVVDTDPDPNATDINPYDSVSIWFNKGMDPNSFFPNMLTFQPEFGLPSSINEGETNFPDPNLLVITISGDPPLQPSTKYTFTVNKSVTDLSGNSMSENFEFQFTIKAAPQIGSTNPADLSTDVSVDTNIAITFDRAMNTDSVEASFKLDPNVTGTFVWFDSNTRVSFQPDSDLTSGITYQVTIDTNARDADGIPLGSPYTWSFTTLSDPNDLFPSIESVFPAEDESSASIYTNIKIEFSRAMDTNSVEGAFNLLDDQNAVVAGSFLWSMDSTEFQFDPNGLLDPNHTYKASITTLAKSESGFFLKQAKTWVFTTIEPETISEPTGGWPIFDIEIDPNMGIDPNSISVTAIALNPTDGGAWVGLASSDPNNNYTGLGLFHYDGDDWKQYSQSDPNCGLTSSSINDLAFDSQGNLWIATEPDPNGSGGGVNMFDGQNWYSYSPDNDPNTFYIVDRGSLSQPEIQDFFNVNAINVYSGTEDTVWIATTGGIGVGRYNSGSGEWEWSAKADPRLLFLLAVDDSTGTVWLESGNIFPDPNEPCDNIAGLDADDVIQGIGQWPDVWDPNIWVWAPNGGFPKIRLLGEIRPNLRAIAVDGFKNLWLGTKDGLYKISIDDLLLGVCDYKLYGQSETGGGLLSDSIYDVIVNPDDPNELWVSTDSGISAYKINESIGSPASWTRYPLTDIQVFKMLPSADGGVKAATDRGLLIINDTTNPTVTSSYPTHQSTDIPVAGPFWVTFSELMDTNTTEAAFTFTDANSSAVSGSLSWEGMTLKFTPSALLGSGLQYSMIIQTTASDLVGNAISQAFQSDFSTTGGWVSSTYPTQGAQSVPIDVSIRVNFTRPMDPNSVEAAFCLQVDPNWQPGTCVEGTFTWPPELDNEGFIFSPTEALSGETNYILTIDDTAEDPNGISMPESFTLTFKTASIAPKTFTFTGVGCFIQSIEDEKISIFERFKGWLHFNPQE